MKRKYYRIDTNDFANTYRLVYVENEADAASLPENAEEIPYAEAKRLAIRERQRRKEEPNFSGYADDVIYPAEYDWNTEGDWRNLPGKYRYSPMACTLIRI